MDRADQVMIAHLSNPQQSRYCYTCWRPGHFSANCPLIPEGERAAIARRHADIMRLRDQRQHYTRGPQHDRTHYGQTPTPVPISIRAPVAKSPTKEAVDVIYDSPEKGQLALDQTGPCESQ
jgi:Zinc knuckle